MQFYYRILLILFLSCPILSLILSWILIHAPRVMYVTRRHGSCMSHVVTGHVCHTSSRVMYVTRRHGSCMSHVVTGHVCHTSSRVIYVTRHVCHTSSRVIYVTRRHGSCMSHVVTGHGLFLTYHWFIQSLRYAQNCIINHFPIVLLSSIYVCH